MDSYPISKIAFAFASIVLAGFTAAGVTVSPWLTATWTVVGCIFFLEVVWQPKCLVQLKRQQKISLTVLFFAISAVILGFCYFWGYNISVDKFTDGSLFYSKEGDQYLRFRVENKSDQVAKCRAQMVSLVDSKGAKLIQSPKLLWPQGPREQYDYTGLIDKGVPFFFNVVVIQHQNPHLIQVASDEYLDQNDHGLGKGTYVAKIRLIGENCFDLSSPFSMTVTYNGGSGLSGN